MVKKIQKHIEIVRSTLPGISSIGKESAQNLYDLLKQHYSRVGITIVNDQTDLENLVILSPDLVFNGIKFIFNDNGTKMWVSEYLDLYDIAYTGSPKQAHQLESDKQLAKRRVSDYAVATARFMVAACGVTPTNESITLRYPLFIKPTSMGGGAGIDDNSLVRTYDELRAKVMTISQKYTSDSLIEEYLPGREFSVAILKNEYSDMFNVMPLELIAPLNKKNERFLSGSVKSADTETFVPVTDASIRSELSDLAMKVFEALGARDYGRVDVRMDADSTPHFLEANLIPSILKDYGNFPKACMLNIGLSYEDMVLQIVRLGLAREIVSLPLVWSQTFAVAL